MTGLRCKLDAQSCHRQRGTVVQLPSLAAASVQAECEQSGTAVAHPANEVAQLLRMPACHLFGMRSSKPASAVTVELACKRTMPARRKVRKNFSYAQPYRNREANQYNQFHNLRAWSHARPRLPFGLRAATPTTAKPRRGRCGGLLSPPLPPFGRAATRVFKQPALPCRRGDRAFILERQSAGTWGGWPTRRAV